MDVLSPVSRSHGPPTLVAIQFTSLYKRPFNYIESVYVRRRTYFTRPLLHVRRMHTEAASNRYAVLLST